MANTKPVGVAFSDPALVSGTTIDSAVLTSCTVGSTNTITAAVTGNVTGNLTPVAGTVAAAGSDNTDAGAIPSTAGVVLVTAANATKGAILSASGPGMVLVKNDDAANAVLKIYPPSGAAINALTATTGAYSMAAKTAALFVKYSATQWYTIPLLAS